MLLTFLLVGIAGYLKLLVFLFTIFRVNVRGRGVMSFDLIFKAALRSRGLS